MTRGEIHFQFFFLKAEGRKLLVKMGTADVRHPKGGVRGRERPPGHISHWVVDVRFSLRLKKEVGFAGR